MVHESVEGDMKALRTREEFLLESSVSVGMTCARSSKMLHSVS